MATPKTIILKGYGERKEGVAAAASEILPGMQTEGFAEVAEATGGARAAFAVENDLVGGSIDDAYAAGDTVQYVVALPGAEVYAWLSDEETVEAGDALESAGDGTLQEHDEGEIVAYAAEDVANAAAGDPARIIVEVA